MIALVTGGTAGIGREVAAKLTSAGLEVLITGRDKPRGAVVTADLGATFLPADHATIEGNLHLAEQVRGRVPRLDILVNNAAPHRKRRRHPGVARRRCLGSRRQHRTSPSHQSARARRWAPTRKEQSMRPEFTPSRRDLLRTLAGTAVGAAIIGIPQSATASTSASPSVTEWIDRHAHRLATSDPDATSHDLRHLHGMARGAFIVGLGESTHGAREEFALKHRLVRHLVEHQGFRSVVLEEDWTKGLQIDGYLLHGKGDPQVLLADAGPPWRTEEILDLLVWMRAYNQSHPADPVRFAGADIVAVRASAYDTVTAYVERVAPRYLDELVAHYAVIRPPGNIGAHIAFYRQQPDKQPFIDHARQAYQLVAGLPADDGFSIVLQHSQAIMGFYEYHATGSVAVRDRHMAQTVAFWREYTGGRLIYWASSVHTAVGHPLTVSYPPYPPATQDTAGSLLRTRYGHSYLSVGMSFHHGTVNTTYPTQAHLVPAPPAHFVDAVLARADIGDYLLDLRTATSPLVRHWLHTPTVMRVIGPVYNPANDAEYHMSGGGLGDWFDVIIHQQQVTPTRLLP